MSDDGTLLLLLAGPIGGSALYWMLYGYYRNTDQSHAFERETKIDAKPVSGSDIKVDTIIGTRNAQIQGDNVSAYRTRVRRESD